jgi:hypothetical protein
MRVMDGLEAAIFEHENGQKEIQELLCSLLAAKEITARAKR